ncbi:sigma-70 factor domain-containing protein [Evansella vedderi]|uniref:sigma-70 factor domain-containing protein n=1 Tax=Evansella vedderi TaxID=38282 RepID=UPI0035226ADB
MIARYPLSSPVKIYSSPLLSPHLHSPYRTYLSQIGRFPLLSAALSFRLKFLDFP